MADDHGTNDTTEGWETGTGSEAAGILLILDALLRAIDRRSEVMEWLFAATSPSEAEETVMLRLPTDRKSARAVLRLQWGQLTQESRETIARERDRLKGS